MENHKELFFEETGEFWSLPDGKINYKYVEWFENKLNEKQYIIDNATDKASMVLSSLKNNNK